MATCSSILDWKIPRTEKPGGLQSMGPQRVDKTVIVNIQKLDFWLFLKYPKIYQDLHSPHGRDWLEELSNHPCRRSMWPPEPQGPHHLLGLLHHPHLLTSHPCRFLQSLELETPDVVE